METIKKEYIRCPIDLVLHMIGAKWTIPIVRDLCVAPRRPSELLKSLKGINPKTLTDRLRDLEKCNLVKRQAYQEIPPRVEYSLTTKGEQLIPFMVTLKEIGESWQKNINVSIPIDAEEECSHCLVVSEENKINGCSFLSACER